MKPIHVQAEEMGLMLPLGCTASLIRELGYEVPECIFGPEIYTQEFDAFIRSQWGWQTGFTWALPPGTFDLELAANGEMILRFKPDYGAEEVVPNTWYAWDWYSRNLLQDMLQRFLHTRR